MGSFLDKVILSNTIQAYLVCIGTIMLVLLIKRYLSRYIAGLIFGFIKRAQWQLDKKAFVDLLVRPLGIFLFLLISLIALDKLNYPKVLEFEIYHKVPFRQIVESVAKAIMVIAFIWLLLRTIDFIALLMEQRANLTADLTDNQLVVFFKDFFKVIIIIIGFLMLLAFSFNRDIGTLLAGFGIVGAAMALAARESLENLIASFIIFFDKPFTVGDLVKVQNITGTVEKIGLRSTRVRTDQKTYVTVPNKQMVDSIMDNLSLRSQRRVDLKLEISLSASATDMAATVTGIQEIIAKYPAVESSTVFMSDILPNAYVVVVEYYTAPIPIKDFNLQRQNINLDILKLLEVKKVELAGLNTEVKLSGNFAADIKDSLSPRGENS